MRTCNVREDLRDSILDAVGVLIERYGYGKTTVEDIARQAGIGKGTVYLCFPSKEEVALCWIDRTNSRIQDELRAIATSDASPAERLRELLVHRVMARFDHAALFAESLDELMAAIRPALLERRSRYRETEAAIIAEVLIAGAEQGLLVIDDAPAIAHALLAATQSLMPFGLSVAQLGRRDEVENRIQRIADLLLNGLRRR